MSQSMVVMLHFADSLRSHLDEAARSAGLTPPQAHLLIQLDAPLRMSDLAERRLCDPSTITAMIQRLERDGFVERASDPHDGRVRHIRVTSKGRRARSIFLEIAGDGSSLVSDLTAEQRAMLAALFG